VPSAANKVVITQGSLDDACFVAAYGGKAGLVVAAVAFDHGKWLEYYRHLIERAAPFPPARPVHKQHRLGSPVSARFPDPREPTYDATVVLTGYDPNEQRVEWIPRTHAAATPHVLVNA
jgi:hypothetical protein